MPALQGVLVAGLVLIHCCVGHLRFLAVTPRSIWLSGAGGVAVAYVFVHLLPELSETSGAIARGSASLALLEHQAYVIALLGLMVFYGLERLVKRSQRRHGSRRSPGPERSTTSAAVFRLHIASFAAYNLLIGYLLSHREGNNLQGLLSYFFAMGLHLMVTDFGLRLDHRSSYDRLGRWLLSAALVAGWLLGLATTISVALTGALFAFLAGGTVLNILKEELPDERQSRFLPFALGALGYAALLLTL